MAERADVRRNRERLLDAAATAFGAAETTAAPMSLEAIARAAGVGIGTLYRHFPTREALVEAVYRAELAEVCGCAAELLDTHPPALALRRWMDRYAAFVGAKRGMAESLLVVLESGSIDRNETRERIVAAVGLLVDACAAAGALRAGVRADDVVSSLLGICIASGSVEQTQRLLDLLQAGIVVTEC